MHNINLYLYLQNFKIKPNRGLHKALQDMKIVVDGDLNDIYHNITYY